MFGNVTFEAGGKSYTLCLDFGARRLVEQHYKEPFHKFIQRRDNFGCDELAVLFWAGLFYNHELTQRAVEILIQRIGEDRAWSFTAQSLKDAASPAAGEGANGSAHPPSPATPDLITTPH